MDFKYAELCCEHLDVDARCFIKRVKRLHARQTLTESKICVVSPIINIAYWCSAKRSCSKGTCSQVESSNIARYVHLLFPNRYGSDAVAVL